MKRLLLIPALLLGVAAAAWWELDRALRNVRIP